VRAGLTTISVATARIVGTINTNGRLRRGQRREAAGATEAARTKERRERATLCHARAGSFLIEIKVCRRGPVSVRCCGSTVSSKRPGVYA